MIIMMMLPLLMIPVPGMGFRGGRSVDSILETSSRLWRFAQEFMSWHDFRRMFHALGPWWNGDVKKVTVGKRWKTIFTSHLIFSLPFAISDHVRTVRFLKLPLLQYFPAKTVEELRSVFTWKAKILQLTTSWQLECVLTSLDQTAEGEHILSILPCSPESLFFQIPFQKVC